MCSTFTAHALKTAPPHADEFLSLPIRLVPRLREDQIRMDFTAYLADEYGLRKSSVNQYARAILPDANTMQVLSIDVPTPLLEVEYTLFLDDGQPYLHAHVRHMPGYELRNNYVL